MFKPPAHHAAASAMAAAAVNVTPSATRLFQSAAARLALNSIAPAHRHCFTDHQTRAARGLGYLRFLLHTDPAYPIVEGALPEPRSVTLSTVAHVHAPASKATATSTRFTTFHDFLLAYDAYLSDGTMPRTSLPDPLYGLDPTEGLMSAEEVAMHCRVELASKVRFHERAALQALKRGLEESNVRLGRFLLGRADGQTTASATQ